MGQLIQTPTDLSLDPPDPNDQPYAGLLYGSCGFHVQQSDYAESLALIFGVVGPLSLAEKTQDIAHEAANTRKAGSINWIMSPCSIWFMTGSV